MILRNTSLKKYNTFGIDVNAAEFAVFNSVEELERILSMRNTDLPLLILGGGSNILFTKEVEAFVLKNEISGMEIVGETADYVDLKVGAGMVWHEFVLYTIAQGWGGVENLSLIPGSVGASPMQNIGAYGAEIKDVFVSLEALEIKSNKLKSFDKTTCAFGYRESVFKKELKGQYIITSVTYRLTKKPTFNTGYGAIQSELDSAGVHELSVKAISDAVIAIRQSKLPDPKVLGNAGSFFKNPIVSKALFERLIAEYPNMPNYPQVDNSVKLAAGWLIEQVGLKGFRIGDCGVHEKQALVLVNYGSATGDEIFALSELIIGKVESKFSVKLEREVNIW